jgi:hypothetical protein
MKKTKPTSVVPSYVGDEYRISLMRALNSYNFSGFDIGDGEKALQAYSKSNNLGVGKIKLSGSITGALTFGKLADLMNRQTFVLNERDQARLVSWIQNLEPVVEEEVVDVTESKSTRVSIQDAIENKARVFIGETLEGLLDDGTYAVFSMGDKLRAEQIGQPQCKYIESWVSKKIIEMIDVAQTEDKEVKGAYKNVNVKKLIKVLADWKQQVEQYANFKKANRKQVVRKPKTAAVQVKSIKYMSESKELGIKSIRPAEMIGKEQVWVYNTKYRKLTVFRASSRAGIQAKGSAIQNWDPETSETRTLRKPEETIKRVVDGGKLVLRKVMEELTTAKQEANGRFNEHTLIIKVL